MIADRMKHTHVSINGHTNENNRRLLTKRPTQQSLQKMLKILITKV